MSDDASKETPKAAAAFAEYCAMGVDRSLRGLEDKIGTKLSQLGQWSRKYHWQDRVAEFDVKEIERKRRKRETEIEKMNERHAQIGVTQQARAIEQIKKLIEAERFGSQASVQLLKLATDLERLARGAATERQEVTGQDGKPLLQRVEIYKVRIPDNGRDSTEDEPCSM